MAKATGTHNGTKTPSVLLYKTACREKVYYRGRRGMWWGYNTTGVGGGWDGVVGYESGLMGYRDQLEIVMRFNCISSYPTALFPII